MLCSALINRALEVAAIAHEGGYRKNPGEAIPYISHCAMVGLILQRAGMPDSVVAAGILHDVLEDTSFPRERLIEEFGGRIVDWIDWVSEQDKSLPWEVRKERYRQRLVQAPPEALAIVAADKIHNMYSTLASLGRGEAIWDQFRRGPEQTLANQRAVFEAIRRRIPPSLASEYAKLLEQMSLRVGR